MSLYERVVKKYVWKHVQTSCVRINLRTYKM